MTYSIISILAIIVQYIINIDVLKDFRKDVTPEKRAYRLFLYSLFAYYITDAAWGFLYDWQLEGPLFLDTELYFVAMACSILMWTRYVLVYLGVEDSFAKALKLAGWGIFWFQVIGVVANCFVPILFHFDETGVYHGDVLRYIFLAVQVLMFLLTSFYTLYVTGRSEGSNKRRHMTIFMFGLVMTGAIIIQLFYPLFPWYGLGCLMGVCLLHTFVQADEKLENLHALQESLDREELQQKELGETKRLVYVDSLTHVKNKHAHVEAEERIDARLKTGDIREFAVVAFDVNDLKKVNDRMGHEAGDQYLKEACKIICDTYDHSPVYRIGGDEFVAILEGRDYEDRDALIEMFDRKSEDNLQKGQVVVAAGMAVYNPEMDSIYGDVQQRADDEMYRRKYFLKGEVGKGFVGRGGLSDYLVEHIDEAIEKKWIKVYYQPIIRSLTGDLCDAEALARWDDPKLGFLAPDQFVSVLEDHALIHRLDCYIVEELFRDMRDSLQKGRPLVPASINFSRLDFVLCDILGFVEEMRERYEIPRELIHIEVTESMLVEDMALMKRGIESFHNAGYEIWMDDFGKGYSSLHLLKDVRFDLVKLDMEFLSSMSDRSRAIMRAIVSMAKEIGIKTLAEGVETQEQIDFLKEIGCSRMQGFYFGRPLPREEYFQNIEKRGLAAEPLDWRAFYDIAGRRARATDKPLELVEYEDGNFHTLFMNQAYKTQIFVDEPDLEEVDRRLYRIASPLLPKYREYMELIRKTGKEETFYYTADNTYLCFTGQIMAQKDGKLLMEASVVNISRDKFAGRTDKAEASMREINHLFDLLARIMPEEDKIEMQLGKVRYMADSEDNTVFSRTMASFAEKAVHEDDRKRFLSFVDGATLRERVESSDKGYVVDLFRVRRRGAYRYREVCLLMIPGTGGHEYLFSMKKLPKEADAALQNAAAGLWAQNQLQQ